MTYFFETYGCEMNIAESASVEQLLLSRGWEKSENAETANLVIINTCSVRGTAENRIAGRLGYFAGVKKIRAKQPGAKTRLEEMKPTVDYVEKNGITPFYVVVMGCMAERLLKTLKEKYPAVDFVVGTFGKNRFGDIITAVEENAPSFEIDDTGPYQFAENSYEQNAFSTFVPIMHGCNNFCTYCIVPYVRGREVSRPVDKILSELDFLSGRGVREITLLGQNVNAYRGIFEGKEISFPALLKVICAHIKNTDSSIKWIRFESSNPKDFSDELIDVIADEESVCRGLHIAAQHGNDEILKKMNRKNTREEFLALVKKLREKVEGVQIVSDLMVGFPGETEEQFNDIISLMNEVKFESSFMYYFNPREGTPAAKMDGQIDIETKKRRLQKIIDLQLEHTHEVMTSRIGKEIEVLADIVSRDNKEELLGKTSQNERVAFCGDKSLIGKFVRVKITSLNGNTFKGEMIK